MKSYVVADLAGAATNGYLDRISTLVDLGIDYIQLRNKEASPELRLQNAAAVRARVRSATRFIVNSDVAAALETGADGLHLPADRRDLADLLTAHAHLVIGQSCHGVNECRAAATAGAHYVLLGPAFAPRSKERSARVSLEEFREAAATGVEVYALGGVSVDNLSQLSGAGLAGVAAITLFMSDEPIDRIVETVRRL